MEQETKNLIKLFSLIAFIKILLSFYMKGPVVFSDEPCVTRTAMYFAENFTLDSCTNITGMADAGATTPPLYPIIISPIYWFFTGMKAYYAILILNSLLFSSLIFPLYSIFKTFLGKHKSTIINIVVTLFMTSTMIYEKLLMTEGLFIIINVWFLFFYLKALKEDRFRFKIVAILVALLAAISRPFGFIVPLSMGLNEFIISRNKRTSLLFLTPLLIVCYFVLQHFVPGFNGFIMEKIRSLENPDNLILALRAIKNQFNSLTISTFFIGIILFIQFFSQKDPLIKKLKYYFLILVSLNFLISAQHMYGYYLHNEELHLLTRYINISTVFIYIFALINISNTKKIHLGLFSKLFSIFLIILFIFSDKYGKFVQNLDLLPLYKIIDDKTTTFFYQINYFLIPLFLIFLFLATRNKKILLRNLLTLLLLIQTTFSLYSLHNIQQREYSVTNFFLNKSGKKITYIITPKYGQLPEFWKIMALTDNKLYYQLAYEKPEYSEINTDYIVTNFEFSLPPLYEYGKIRIYAGNPSEQSVLE